MSHLKSEESHRTSTVEVADLMDPKDAGQAAIQIEDDPPSTSDSLAEGAGQGALSGGIVGGVMGILSPILMPGVGPLIAEGLLGTVLAAASVGAAIGGIIGALVRSEDLAREARTIGVHEPWTNRFWQGEDRRGRMSFNYAGPERRFSFS